MLYESENERLGMKACTPRGYELIGWGDFCGFIAAIVFWIVVGTWLFRGKQAGFSWHQLWWLLLPAAVVVAGQLMEKIGWSMAAKKQFHYDYDSNTATWMEDGRPRIYPDSQ